MLDLDSEDKRCRSFTSNTNGTFGKGSLRRHCKTEDGKVQMTIEGVSGSPIESIADNDKVEIAQS